MLCCLVLWCVSLTLFEAAVYVAQRVVFSMYTCSYEYCTIFHKHNLQISSWFTKAMFACNNNDLYTYHLQRIVPIL